MSPATVFRVVRGFSPGRKVIKCGKGSTGGNVYRLDVSCGQTKLVSPRTMKSKLLTRRSSCNRHP